MNYVNRMKEEWANNFKTLTQTSLGFQKLSTGTMSVDEYKSILRHIYQNVRVNSQIMAMATMHFKGSQRDSIKGLLKHAVQETGHENLALDDLKTLGADVSNIQNELPSPASIGLTGAVTYMVEHISPITLLGYMFHLEYTPTQVGHVYIDKLSSIGVPMAALTFIKEHAEVDVGHVKLMDKYVADMVQSEEDFQFVVYGMKVTCELYGKMIDEAIQTANK